MSVPDFVLDIIAYKQFKEEEDIECDGSDHVRRVVRMAIREELTETERLYFLEYIGEGKTMKEIAMQHNVTISSVSKTISRAKRKLWKCLRYAHPRFLNASITKRNRRAKKENDK